jgi:hypothetical protein
MIYIRRVGIVGPVERGEDSSAMASLSVALAELCLDVEL